MRLWSASPGGSAGPYLAPAYRDAASLIEAKGVGAFPLMLTGQFAYGLNIPHNISGWTYCFTWVDIDGSVKGFYLRSEGEPDIDLFPELINEPQIPGTGWMIVAGPVLASDKERSKVPEAQATRAIVVPPRVFKRKKLLIGLILAEGQKSAPSEAYIGQ